MAGKDGGAAERAQSIIERQVNQLIRLVDDLLEVSRITSGKIELRKEEVELADIIRSAVETSKPLIEAAQHQLAISIPEYPIILDADPIRVTQILANVLNNAAKYTKNGGQISLTASSDETTADVSVKDNGVGIPADMLPKVFDPFTQLGHAYNRAQGGLGIGLTLARDLAIMDGGTMEAKSKGVNQGSEFILRLPLAAGIHPAEPRETVSGLTAVASRRILVVDDNSDAADALGMLLKLLGADVRTANDGVSAVEAVSKYRPDIVLLDISMPGMDGYEVARRVRQTPEGRKVALIALSGRGQEEDRRLGREAGFDHYLVKPVDLNALQALQDLGLQLGLNRVGAHAKMVPLEGKDPQP
jgi:CheY-like chemotaxis protein/anti-sigma regulatory factor (Ser/Thr protein kinase)